MFNIFLLLGFLLALIITFIAHEIVKSSMKDDDDD
jgi:hypothetical protein